MPPGASFYILDALAWLYAIPSAAIIRYDFQLDEINWVGCLAFVVFAMLLQFAVGTAFHLYGHRKRSDTGDFEEALTIASIGLTVGFALWVVSLIFGGQWGISRGMMLIATPLALLVMFGARYIARVWRERSMRPGEGSTPALIYGAGHVGGILIHWMMSDSSSRYLPVGLLDDAPGLKHRRIRGVPVLGSLDDLQFAAESTGAQVLIIAIARADAALLSRAQDRAHQLGVTVKVMASLENIMDNRIRGHDLRDLAIEDLLGRKQVETDVAEIASYLTGKRVLVTGAGGSIGSQLCTEISRFAPSELIMLDRDETGLQGALINVAGNGLLDTEAVVLADIRDSETLTELFINRRPQVVFHAAALKHLPMLEQYPEEAWKTNVLGTLNVLRASEAANVETFINISTDKAANPTSVLGYSKRYAERLTAWFGVNTGRPYLSVRFGNVIGSRGSMLPTFMRLIEEDKPLTVTHPDVTRYFMTIPEACQLVLQAGGIGQSGEVLILDMGEPVNILEIAKKMIEISGKEIQIVFTGLRAGEKMHEELVGDGETEFRPFHPLISHAHAEVLGPEQLNHDDFSLLLGKAPHASAGRRELSK
nr:nucleoside-diphosphate sugar epimerase/dehydratase [Corynebacterium pacaense]